MMRKARFVGVFQGCHDECAALSTTRVLFLRRTRTRIGGRRRQVTKAGCASAADEAAARATVVDAYRAGHWPTHPSMTVGEWLQQWFTTETTAGTLRPTTARCYRQRLHDYLMPRLGAVRLSRLRVADITALDAAIAAADRLQEQENIRAAATGRAPRPIRRPRPFGPTSVVRLHGALHAALNAAVRAGEVASNPARYAEVPRRTRAKVQPWSPQEYGALLDYLQDTHDPMAALFRVAGHTGLRRGELCGLRWTEVNTQRRVLVVRRQIRDIGAGLTIGKPKPRSGEDRIVDLDRGTASMLHFLRLRQRRDTLTAGSHDSGFVFTGPDGRPWHPATVSHRFRRLTAARRPASLSLP